SGSTSPFPQIYEQTIDDKEVVVIQVFPGGHKPFFIASEGTQKGVYIRVGAHTRRAEGELLNELLLNRSRLSYDEEIIDTLPIDKLDLNILPSHLQTEKAMLSLGLIKHNPFTGKLCPTRGGVLMLFENPERFIKEAFCIISKMSGREGYDTIESHDISGCIPKQSLHVINLLKEWLGIYYEVDGPHLKNRALKLPLIAIREAVNNALFHRQYSIQGPIKIALFTNRLEIFSPGHFSGPFIPESLGDGTSYIRNSVISQTARRLNLIEKRGTGIKLIIESVHNYGLPHPLFEEGSNWFKVSLFL
ncbi:MAG: ATP-dependent DNA helicase RecG, partial [Candidatus Magnetoglobus multicellularis str. Araruama]